MDSPMKYSRITLEVGDLVMWVGELERGYSVLMLERKREQSFLINPSEGLSSNGEKRTIGARNGMHLVV